MRTPTCSHTGSPLCLLPLDGIDVAVLVGGLGTRLRGVVSDVPKPMAPVLGRPFLYYQLDMLALRGARSVTLCCGYMADSVRNLVGECWMGMPIRYAIETAPLGTGGALKNAASSLTTDRVLVMNGDSWLEPDWSALSRIGSLAGSAVLTLVHVPDSGRFGAVDFDGQMVRTFQEKDPDQKDGFINGGVYLISRELLARLPEGHHSLERDVFPKLATDGTLQGLVTRSPFLDIGVPESYAAAAGFFSDLGIAPHPMFPEHPDMSAAQPKLGVCAAVIDEAGRILLEQRSDCGWWCLPGGRMEAGESLVEGAKREVREETGLEMEMTGFLGVFSDPKRRTVCYLSNGDLRQLVDVVVMARPAGGQLAASSESMDVAWFGPGELPLNTVPAVVEILRQAFAFDGVGILR